MDKINILLIITSITLIILLIFILKLLSIKNSVYKLKNKIRNVF